MVQAICTGSCNGDGEVTINELLIMVNIALGTASLSDCEPGDANQDGEITVNEILVAVNNALNGCTVTAASRWNGGFETRRYASESNSAAN
jgi:hypothetical protein